MTSTQELVLSLEQKKFQLPRTEAEKKALEHEWDLTGMEFMKKLFCKKPPQGGMCGNCICFRPPSESDRKARCGLYREYRRAIEWDPEWTACGRFKAREANVVSQAGDEAASLTDPAIPVTQNGGNQDMQQSETGSDSNIPEWMQPASTRLKDIKKKRDTEAAA